MIESIEVRELLRFLYYLAILNKLLLQQRKQSKYMYAKCLNFSCSLNILHVLSERLPRVPFTICAKFQSVKVF